ncbi:hypothetical protein HHK36_021092 [Tetracentron sinense]|uniref:Uncharacterized protein n=1 Tax=Tetracentron sinense TaxID=13715 RepID=A0A835D6R7_TETSI|nr:hypothetical protein HHK36_021092 [Tetracentron sinense]
MARGCRRPHRRKRAADRLERRGKLEGKSTARSKERKARYISELERKVQTLQIKSTILSTQLMLFQYNKICDLKGNRLSGQIPDEIGDCSSLKSLDLSFNEIYGDIPLSISKLKQLESLFQHTDSRDLAQNKLSGEIPRLIYWNEVPQGLRGKNLVGALSPDMCQLTGLWYLTLATVLASRDLSYNQLTREIPFNIGLLQVATLSLQGNQLSGKIPSVIGLMQALAMLNLTYTEKLYLHGNKLTGSITPELRNMTKLHYLELNDNQLSGHIPPELGKLTDLFDLNFANNNLEGPIPDNLSSCTNLNSLNVEGNKLNESIPYAFERLESMTYLVQKFEECYGDVRSLTFETPDIIDLSVDHSATLSIMLLHCRDISNNGLSGPIPQELGPASKFVLPVSSSDSPFCMLNLYGKK